MTRRFLAPTPARRALPTRLLAGAGALAVATLASGCAVFSPVQTDVAYNPSDGIPANIGDLAIRDLVLVSKGGGPAVVSGSAINLGTTPLTVRLAALAADGTPSPSGSEIELGARGQVDLSTQGLELNGVTGKPGTLARVQVTSTIGGTTIVTVPILAPVDYYATVTPAPTAG